MDESTRQEFLTLLSWTGPQTQGLGDLLREYPGPGALFADCSNSRLWTRRLAGLPPATQRVLERARRRWPRPHAPGYFSTGSTHSSCNTNTGGAGGASLQSEFLPIADPRYPAQLSAIPDPPPWLFCRGELASLMRPAVAMVGSRRASHAGLQAAARIAGLLADAGYTVCSGLALGIDAAAHRGALRCGSTAAVLASGIDRASPLRHRALAQEIEVSGCVLTELPPGTPPSKHQFPRRNRIISGLALATIIVEAALPSGSLHTAASALEQGREVYVLPWSVFHNQGAGCLHLLRDGATPITSFTDVADFFPGVAADDENKTPPEPASDGGRVLTALGDQPLSVDTLMQETGLAPAELLRLLGELEVAGRVRREDGRYCRQDCKSCD